MKIQEDLTFGIDLGIASCGWAVIRGGDGAGEIVALGTWMFDAPENHKRESNNQARRRARGMRRVIKRRRQRMNEVRRLFAQHGLLSDDGKDALWIKDGDGRLLDPWALRAEGLNRRLTGAELAVALAHIAKHRGFKSNSKRDLGTNTPPDASPEDKAHKAALKAVSRRFNESQQSEQPYQTVGEMYARDEAFALRKRNRMAQYVGIFQRDDQAREVALLFAKQRGLGSALATSDLEAAFLDEDIEGRPFHQGKLRDSDDLVAFCNFEPEERRATRRAPSFELFRFLDKLNKLKVGRAGEEGSLAPAMVAAAEAAFWAGRGVTLKALRKLIGLKADESFAGVKLDDEKFDVAARSGAAAEGTSTLRTLVTDGAGALAWAALRERPELLDDAAFVLTFRDDPSSIRKGLEELGLPDDVLRALLTGVQGGEFATWRGSGQISAKAARKMIPHLRSGLTYDKAARAAGYEHTDSRLKRDGSGGVKALKAALRPNARGVNELGELINSPVARKAVSEALKQVIALVREFGVPGAIHVELAREVGKGLEEREKLLAGQKDRFDARAKAKAEFASVVGPTDPSPEDLLRYELWKEQNGFCLYSNRSMDPRYIISSDKTLEVDHILPRGSSQDDGFRNKLLCFAGENQSKAGRTPYGWLRAHPEKWDTFAAAVETSKGLHKQKRRNLLSTLSLEDIESRFKPRNLNDTQYATKVLLSLLVRLYPAGERGFELPRPERPEREKRRVFARPGSLTNALRNAWSLQELKKTEAGARRSDDRHHALDALIVAATSESALNRLTRQIQQRERAGLRRDVVDFVPPWPGFVEEARERLQKMFVARAERRRARGEAHKAILRESAERDERTVVYEKWPVGDLTEKDLTLIKDPERNAALADAIRTWLVAGRPVDQPPLSPNGDVIRQVKVRTKHKAELGVVRGGREVKAAAAARGDMVRVDVFRKSRKNGWEHFLVPVYPHEVFNRSGGAEPPNRIARANTSESEWPTLTPDHEFRWSLYPMSFIEVEQPDGTFIDGYFRGLNRNTASIAISTHNSKDAVRSSIGAQRLKHFSKWSVDRLGRKHVIEREVRTWQPSKKAGKDGVARSAPDPA